MVRRSVTETVHSIDAEALKDSAAAAAATVSDVGAKAAKEAGVLAGQAKDAAVHAKEWAEPRAREIAAWVRPRAEKAWHDSVHAAAPRVEKLADQATPLIDTAHEKLVPLIDTAHEKFVPFVDTVHVRAGEAVDVAHDKIVDDYLPRLVTVVREAAAKTTDGAEGVTAAVVEAVAPAKRKRKGLFWLLVTGAAAAVGYLFWRRAQPQNDPWAEPWEQSSTPDYEGMARDAKHRAADAAEAVGEAAGTAYARSREAGEKIAERATEAGEKIAERATEAGEKIAERVEDAVDKATDAAKKAATRVRPDDADEAADNPPVDNPGDSATPATDTAASAAVKPKPRPKPGKPSAKD